MPNQPATNASLLAGTDIEARALYVHIPFCASRCHYCDFATYVAPVETRDVYVDALIRELELIADQTTEPLQSVFFGGGTPTLLDTAQLDRLLAATLRLFRLEENAEVTIEANPGTVSFEKLSVLRQHAVNRISFGAQTFNETLLLAIGRLHDADTVDKSVELAQKAGFTRISVDLMFGLPDQTLKDVADALQRFFAYGIEHVSAYWLKIEPGTPFQQWYDQGFLKLPGEDNEGDMYDFVRETLESHGFRHYEVSNFARPGGESVHNLVYWHNEPYLAAGVGAYGYVHQIRYENTRSLTDYIGSLNGTPESAKRPVTSSVAVSAAEYAENTMMLGMRLREGVSQGRFERMHGLPMELVFGSVIDNLRTRGLVAWRGDTLVVTPEAWPVANLVFEEFVGALTGN